jgi:hypothetical protein
MMLGETCLALDSFIADWQVSVSVVERYYLIADWQVSVSVVDRYYLIADWQVSDTYIYIYIPIYIYRCLMAAK